MVISEKTFSIGATQYTVRVENLRKFARGVVAFDISTRRDGSTDIISNPPSATVSAGGRATRNTGLSSPPSGRFRTDTVYAPASAGEIYVEWAGEYGTQTPSVEFTIEGFGEPPVGICDYVSADGTVPETIGGKPAGDVITAVINSPILSASDGADLVNAFSNGGTVEQCVGGGETPPQQRGLSTAAIGVGIVGLGVVAVALMGDD